MVKEAGPHMRDGQVMVFNTGYWSALRFQDYFAHLGKQVILTETSILLYICSITAPAHVRIDGIKATVPVAAYPGKLSSVAFDLLDQAFDSFTLASSILETNLVNINYVFHPPIVLANLAVVEHTRGDFTFYREGVTPAVAKLVHEVDQERLHVAASLGLNLDPSYVWLKKAYGAQGNDIYEALHTTEAYAPSRYTHVLKDIEHANFITEDVPYGLGPLVSLGEVTGVPTPTVRSIIQLLSVVTEKDHLAAALTMDKLGLGGLSGQEIVQVLVEGR
jgi:opine dehydrogenase